MAVATLDAGIGSLSLPPAPFSSPGLVPQLEALIQQRFLNGYALISLQGIVGDAVGPIAADLQTGAHQQGTLPEAALQFLRPFNTADATTERFEIAGTVLVVVRQEPGNVLALGPRRTLGLAALQLAGGLVLVATWGRNVLAPNAFTVLDRLVQPYRQ